MASDERVHVTVRVAPGALVEVERIAVDEFDGVRSMALRRVFALGLQAWRVGCRRPDDVGKVGS